MEVSPKAGQVHALPENEVEVPQGTKKPRLAAKKSQKTESKRSKKRRGRTALPEPCSAEDVIWRDIIAVLGEDAVDKAAEEGAEFNSPFEFHQEVVLEVASICSNGEAIARSLDHNRPWAVIVPFALPGEKECPIATSVINDAYKPLRDSIANKILTYKKGVSLLLRDSLEIGALPVTPRERTADPVEALSTSLEKHVCITDHKAIVREKVGDWLFEYTAGSFFQNNNSVLIPLTNYVRDAIFPPGYGSVITMASDEPPPTYLVDAYCGAGLFAITLSPHFQTVAGIELSQDSIKSATSNAILNGISPEKITFRAGDAADIFATVGEFPPAQTVLLIDPPRKGCDDNFINQLLKFRCRTVVYVSCNVHTQARDVGKILKATEDELGRKYILESVRGFDLFPQTAHVESVAVLRLV
ncbi:hypothetical protein H0H81_006078 [Sphagnurus paluster]|uniref:Uncharacterized protein n=1 Tax=Sphagnurus paluster TaxID=117069 RepID=A0A9P7FVL8_9AGAR|nr:hypothetical protein H0H81_006078 [Sphagnurus paluster]